jgi:hypothetical protein
MGEQEKIRSKVARLRGRRRGQIVLDHSVRGLFWGAIPAALALFACKLWIIPLNEFILAGALLAAVTIVFTIRGLLLRLTPLAVANDIDLRLGLRERISSALALGSAPSVVSSQPQRGKPAPVPQSALHATQPADPFVRALIVDAAQRVDKLPARRVYPWQLPGAWRLALPALLIAAALSFLPQLNWFVNDSDRANAKLLQEQGQSLKDLAKELEKQAEVTKDPVLKQQAEELKRIGEKLDSGQMKKKDALKELQRLKEKLEKQAQPPAGEKKLLTELGEQLAQNTQTRQLGELLKQGDMTQLNQQLTQIAQSLAQGQLSPQQQQDMQSLLQAIDEALKSDAASDPEAQQLKQNLEQLKQQIQQNEQLQQALQQALQNFSQSVQNLNQQLNQNGMQQQAQQLSQTMQQMQQQQSQNGMVSPQTLQQMAQQLQSTQQQIQQNQQLSPQQQQQLGQAAQQALSQIQGQQGQPGQLSQQNQQLGQNQQNMSQQMQKTGECTSGG